MLTLIILKQKAASVRVILYMYYIILVLIVVSDIILQHLNVCSQLVASS